MQNPRLASVYAKALMDIALEKNILDVTFQDIQLIQALFTQSKDFALMMKSPIIKADKKSSVLKAITEGKLNPVTDAFLNLIIQKGRESFLGEIVNAFIQQYKKHNRITDVKITTATPLDDEMKSLLNQKIAAQFPDMKIELHTQIEEKLLGGFILEANNNIFDASIARDLYDIKKQFLKNEYVQNIR